ncbi:CCHC-type domain-containing protein [Heracleum sosnowskyi]|uniref:CCHC-type domain-containing protein n=1 Tax=Heracleum sosnowskyi TaxID=360622 RepID=A0AAD8MRQ4_9APIA|nr:CCHC-type domain-containing protein [Heracleum sosnowskyi]
MVSKGKEIVTGKGKGKEKLNYSNASSGLRKRKNSDGVLRFLDIAAHEADGESDSSSIDSFINDQREHLEDEILGTAIVKHETETAIDLPFIQNVDDMSLEVLERMVLERYKPGSSLITYAEDEAEDEAEELIDQNIEIPSLEYTSASKVPIIWKVKCTVGREKHSTVCLMQKFVEFQNLGKMLQIVSAFTVEHVKGFLYIEAYKQCDVYEACNGICSTYPIGMVPVPEKELSRLFNVRRSMSNISTGTWIRLKKGKYKGDLAQVMAVNGSSKKATLKLIPRIDLQVVTQKIIGGVAAKKTAVPAQKLISSIELEEFRPLIKNRRDRDTEEVFEILDGMMLKDGYLYKKVSLDSLRCCVVQPSEDDLLKFENSTNEDDGDREWLSELFGEQGKRPMTKGDIFNMEGEDSSNISTENVSKVHDIVLFREKEFGFVISIENDDSCKVLTESSEGQLVVDLKLCEIEKLSCEKKFTAWDYQHNIISTNSRVNVVEGPLQGRVGIVKHIYRGIIFVYDKTDLENGGYFCCKSQKCEKIKFSGLSRKDKHGEMVPLGTDNVVSSSSKSHLVPVKSPNESINSWKPQNCEIPKSFGVPSKEKAAEVEDLGTDHLHSSTNLPLSTKQAPEANTDSRKYYLGGKDVIFKVGQSLKIRMGPLKGYCCQIMALSHSEIMVKLDSQRNTLAVKPEHLVGVNERNTAKPSVVAGGRNCSRDKEKIQRKSDAGRNAATSSGSKQWSKNWNNTKVFIKQVDGPKNQNCNRVFWSNQTETSVRNEGERKEGILERTKTFVRGCGSGGRSGRGSGRGEFGRGRGGGRGESGRGRGGESGKGRGGRGGGRGEFGRGRGCGRSEFGRGRGGGQAESGRGRGGGRSESGRGRGGVRSEFGGGRGGGRSEFGEGRGGGRSEFERGRGGGQGEFERGRGGGQSELGKGRGVGHSGKALNGRGRGSGQGGKEQFNMGRGNGQFNTAERGGGQSNMGRGMEQFTMGQGNGRGRMDQLSTGRASGRGSKDHFNMGRGGKDQFNMGWGNQQGEKEHFEMGRGGKEHFNMGRGNGQGGANQFNMGQRNTGGGMKQFSTGRGNGQGSQSNSRGGRTGRGGTRGGRGQFGRGISSDRGESSGWKGENKQKYGANSGIQMGSPSNRNLSQTGAIGWQSAAGETGNQMRSSMQGNAEAVGRKRGAEMMGDQTKSWGYKKWKQ